jgi:parallel beta-helix repeat protein
VIKTYRTIASSLIATSVIALTVLAAPLPAGAVTCGATIGPGGNVDLDVDIIGPCETNPVLRVVGPVNLNLNGHTVSCGGKLNEPGGANYAGIRVEGTNAQVRNGSVTDCGHGVSVSNDGHTILDMTLRDNDTGIRMWPGGTGGSSLIRNEAFGNRRGLYLTGSENSSLIGNVARNNGSGFRVFEGGHNVLVGNVATANTVGFDIGGDDVSSHNTLIGNAAMGNTEVGFNLRIVRNTVSGNKANGNGGHGFRTFRGSLNVISANVAKDNGGDGLSLDYGGQGNVVEGNRFKNNRGNGVAVQCVGCGGAPRGFHLIRSNIAVGHQAPHFDLLDAITDCGSNTWTGNQFGTKSQECIH